MRRETDINFIYFIYSRPYGLVSQKLLNILTFRELEYLEYIRHRSVATYEEVLQVLRDNIQHSHNNVPNAPMVDDGYHCHPDMHPLTDNKRQQMYPMNSLPRKVDS